MASPLTFGSPKLLDLYCGAGGAGMGYHRAGFDVTGVDIQAQPRYPFRFIQADALEYLREHGHEYDVIHASPPCQKYSSSTAKVRRGLHWDSVPPTRMALEQSGKLWVLENVPGAPLRPDFKIAGDMVGLPLLKRERWFETNWLQELVLMSRMERFGPVITVVGHGTPSGSRKSWGRDFTIGDKRLAMGIDWMTGSELSQAIPPAYTEYIGRRIIEAHHA